MLVEGALQDAVLFKRQQQNEFYDSQHTSNSLADQLALFGSINQYK